MILVPEEILLCNEGTLLILLLLLLLLLLTVWLFGPF